MAVWEARLALGWGAKITELPPAIMLMVLLITVAVGLVDGVTGGDHAPGSVFDEGQAHVAGNGHGGEAFGAGSTLANEDILGNLVAHAAHAGFVVGDFSERLAFSRPALRMAAMILSRMATVLIFF